MQYYLASPTAPFVDPSGLLPSGSGPHSRTNNNNNNNTSFTFNHFGKEETCEGILEEGSVDPMFDDLLSLSMISPPLTAITEQAQEPPRVEQPLQDSFDYQELVVQAGGQQQLDLLPGIHPENIFNSETSVFVYSSVPQRNSVHSFVSVNTPSLTPDTAPVRSLSSVESAVATSFDQPVRDQYSFEVGSTKATLASSARSSVELDLMAPMLPSAPSLSAVINSKNQKLQLRQQSRVEELSSSHDIDASAPSFLNYTSIPLVRGLSSGGNNSRPPKEPLIPGTHYVTARLRLENSNCEDMCLPVWNEHELKDRRRIIRIERRRQSNEIVASFSIVGSAAENPHTQPSSDPDVQVLEVSCLQCLVNDNETDDEQDFNEKRSYRAQSDSTETSKQTLYKKLNGSVHIPGETATACQHYITSVEVIKIIELLVGTHLIKDSQQKRKERGRVRSNLVPFWSKHPVSSSKNTMKHRSGPACNEDYLAELAHRIMTYEVRRPRIFDKNVRILEWSKLGPALQRALQSYYVAVPLDEFETRLQLASSDQL